MISCCISTSHSTHTIFSKCDILVSNTAGSLVDMRSLMKRTMMMRSRRRRKTWHRAGRPGSDKNKGYTKKRTNSCRTSARLESSRLLRLLVYPSAVLCCCSRPNLSSSHMTGRLALRRNLTVQRQFGNSVGKQHVSAANTPTRGN